MFANDILYEDGIKYDNIDESSDEGKSMIEVIKEESLDELGSSLNLQNYSTRLPKKEIPKTKKRTTSY